MEKKSLKSYAFILGMREFGECCNKLQQVVNLNPIRQQLTRQLQKSARQEMAKSKLRDADADSQPKPKDKCKKIETKIMPGDVPNPGHILAFPAVQDMQEEKPRKKGTKRKMLASGEAKKRKARAQLDDVDQGSQPRKARKRRKT